MNPKTKKDGIARLICFAADGTIDYDAGEGYGNCHISGCGSDPEQFCKGYYWWADEVKVIRHSWDSLEIPAEGIPVLDKRQAVETKAGYSWVFRGPMVNVKLQDGNISRLGEVSPIMLPAIAAYGMIGALAENHKAAKENKAGPLDDVSVAEYVRGWVEHGARLGIFTVNADGTGHIEWSTVQELTALESTPATATVN